MWCVWGSWMWNCGHRARVHRTQMKEQTKPLDTQHTHTLCLCTLAVHSQANIIPDSSDCEMGEYPFNIHPTFANQAEQIFKMSSYYIHKMKTENGKIYHNIQIFGFPIEMEASLVLSVQAKRLLDALAVVAEHIPRLFPSNARLGSGQIRK